MRCLYPLLILIGMQELYCSQAMSQNEPIWFSPEANIATIKKFLRENKGIAIDTRNSLGQTGLMYAINNGMFGGFGSYASGSDLDTKTGLVEELVRYGADVNAKSEQSPREEDHSFGNTPLHYASIIVNARDNVPLIDFLIRSGADPNAQNNLLETPLMWSSQASLFENQSAIFEEMITNLADVNIQNNLGDTYLHLLIRNKDIQGVQYMMSTFGSMYDLNLKNKEGLAPLAYAKATLQPESERAIKSFRPLGSDDNTKVRDKLGRNPLMLAIIRNDLPFAERQLKQGAKIDDVDQTKYKNQPIHFAVIRKYRVAPFVDLALKNKADPNAKNAFGDTPLHYLVKYNIKNPEAREVAKILILAGANPGIRNKKGETVLELANRANGSFGHMLEKLYAESKKK